MLYISYISYQHECIFDDIKLYFFKELLSIFINLSMYCFVRLRYAFFDITKKYIILYVSPNMFLLKSIVLLKKYCFIEKYLFIFYQINFQSLVFKCCNIFYNVNIWKHFPKLYSITKVALAAPRWAPDYNQVLFLQLVIVGLIATGWWSVM